MLLSKFWVVLLDFFFFELYLLFFTSFSMTLFRFFKESLGILDCKSTNFYRYSFLGTLSPNSLFFFLISLFWSFFNLRDNFPFFFLRDFLDYLGLVWIETFYSEFDCSQSKLLMNSNRVRSSDLCGFCTYHNELLFWELRFEFSVLLTESDSFKKSRNLNESPSSFLRLFCSSFIGSIFPEMKSVKRRCFVSSI